MTLLSATNLGPLDGAIVVAYLIATILLGIFLGRGQADQRDYFLGGRRLPWWALLLSIVATETSTVTVLSIPGKSYVEGGNFTFLQLAFGFILGRLAIVAWLLPGYFRGETLTAYQILEQRFGTATRRLASLVFLLTRNLADGLRLFLTALALHVAVGLDFVTCVLVITAATAVYACLGGVRSVVWNDCIQFAIYTLGAVVTAVVIVERLPGGWDQLWQFAESTGRLRLLDFDVSLTKASVSFWSGCLGGAFLSLATHGADQLIVQRYLCAKDQRSAGWALALSGPVVLLQFALFLWLGVELACFYSVHGAPRSIEVGDQALITFIVHNLGAGLSGLFLAAVFAAAMSTLSSSLNSSAASLQGDWLEPYCPRLGRRGSLLLAQGLTLLFALLQATVAIVAYRAAIESAVVDAVLAIAGFAIGLLLGLYGLGLLVPRATQRTAIIALLYGLAITSWAVFATPLNGLWYTLVGSSSIVAVGWLLTAVAGRDTKAARSP